jgi:hypothetical protein
VIRSEAFPDGSHQYESGSTMISDEVHHVNGERLADHERMEDLAA